MTKDSKQPLSSHTAYIALYADINGKSAEELTNLIAKEIPQHTHTLYLLICTGGGSVEYGFALYNFLRGLPYKIITHNMANADSIGNILMLAGEERYATENAVFLIHGVKSKIKDEKIALGFMEEKMSCIKSDEDRIHQTILKHSNMKKELLDNLSISGAVFTAQDALKCGLIHDIRKITIPSGANLFTVMASVVE